MCGSVRRLLIVAAAMLLLLTGCSQTVSDPGPAEYSVVIGNERGSPMSNIKVFVYEDSTKSELVCVASTDEQGKLAFTEITSDSFVAVIQDIPVGYSAQETYLLSPGENQITLASRMLTPEEMANVRYGLSDRLPDFTVTDCDGNEHNLEHLLTKKKAVLLNFWFLNCDPCKMEFPYLQAAYESFGDQVAFLALNPIDGTDGALDAYRTEQSLTFPMAVCDEAYQNMLGLTAYPTTVILDRYGNICLMHTGMFTDSAALENALAYFTQDEYTPHFFESIDAIPMMQ